MTPTCAWSETESTRRLLPKNRRQNYRLRISSSAIYLIRRSWKYDYQQSSFILFILRKGIHKYEQLLVFSHFTNLGLATSSICGLFFFILLDDAYGSVELLFELYRIQAISNDVNSDAFRAIFSQFLDNPLEETSVLALVDKIPDKKKSRANIATMG